MQLQFQLQLALFENTPSHLHVKKRKNVKLNDAQVSENNLEDKST